MYKSDKTSRATTAQAEELAVAVLGWLASEDELMGRFLAMSGLRADQLRQAAGEPGFHAGLLDFIMGYEPTLMAFCAASGHSPDQVAACWQVLSGRHLESGEI